MVGGGRGNSWNNFGQEEQCPTSLGPLPPFNLDSPCESLGVDAGIKRGAQARDHLP